MSLPYWKPTVLYLTWYCSMCVVVSLFAHFHPKVKTSIWRLYLSFLNVYFSLIFHNFFLSSYRRYVHPSVRLSIVSRSMLIWFSNHVVYTSVKKGVLFSEWVSVILKDVVKLNVWKDFDFNGKIGFWWNDVCLELFLIPGVLSTDSVKWSLVMRKDDCTQNEKKN